VIVVKENVCENGPDGTAVSVLDEEDSSLTRLVGYRDWWLVEPENMVADKCYLYSLDYFSAVRFTPCCDMGIALITSSPNSQVEQDVGRDLPTSRTQDRQGGGTIGITSGVVHGQELGSTMRREGGRM
jgi:hypothetical protein